MTDIKLSYVKKRVVRDRLLLIGGVMIWVVFAGIFFAGEVNAQSTSFRLEPGADEPDIQVNGGTVTVRFRSYFNKNHPQSNIPAGGIVNGQLKRFYWIENASRVQVSGSHAQQYFPNGSYGGVYDQNPFNWFETGLGISRCVTPSGQSSSLYCPSDEGSVTETFTISSTHLPAGYFVCTRVIGHAHFGSYSFGYASAADFSRAANGWEDLFGMPAGSYNHNPNPSPDASARSATNSVWSITPKICKEVPSAPIPPPPPPADGTFDVVPLASVPKLYYDGDVDEENPNQAVFGAGLSVNNSPSTTKVSVKVEREYFIIPRDSDEGENTLATRDDSISVNNSGHTFPDDTISLSGIEVSAGDRVCIRIRVSPAKGTMAADGTPKVVEIESLEKSPVCIRIVNKPYFRVYGGDVIAGSGFGESCDPTANPGHPARIIGFGEKDGRGSAAQLAAQAIGKISGFSTATLVGRVPKGLSFSNTAGDATYGGAFSDSGVCAHNYFSDRSGYTQAGPTIGAQYQNIAPGSTIRLYRDGDVTINQDITYNLNGWTPSSMPSFYLVVRGDIYISRNVERLDGVFIAQPKEDGTGGVIYTCTMPGNSGLPSSSNDWESCEEKRLTVNGSLIAQKIKLYRTRGSMRESSAADGRGSGNPAELFIYSPEIWMASPNAGGLNVGNYDSITSLPPVL